MSKLLSGSGLETALSRLAWPATVVIFGVLPAIVLAIVFYDAAADDAIAFDFRPFYRAAEALLSGDNPYPTAHAPLDAASGPYVYPPLPALASVPLTLLPFDVAGLVVMASLVLAAFATLRVLGVRDWRCYGVIMLWPPVISAIQTGNVTLWLALAAAVAWRYRDRVTAPAGAIGVTLAVKLFLWPLVVWLAATRRVGSGIAATAIGIALLLLSWAAIGFDGLIDYPDLLRRLEDTVGADSYTAYIVALDAGLPSSIARALWLGFGLAVLAAMVVLTRRGEERAGFILALAAALLLTPIVWLHYFALLVVIVAVAQPRIAIAWFVPLAMVITPGSGQPTPFETAGTLTIAAVTVLLAIRATRADAWGARAEPNPARRPRAQVA